MTVALDYSRTPSRHRWHTTHWILAGLVVFASTIDAARALPLGAASGLGAITFASVGLVWALWLSSPTTTRSILRATLFLLLFAVYAAGTLLWSSLEMLSVQLLVIYLGFTGLIYVTAREVHRDPTLAGKLLNVVLVSSAIPTLLYSYTVFTGHKGEDGFVSCRPFALYAMIPVAVALATWRRPNPREKQPWPPLLWALFVTFIVYGSLSRTALIGCLIMYPLAVALRMTRRGLVTAVLLLAAGGSAFVGAILTNQELYDRFFKNDAAIKVGGVAINASGRTKIWRVVLDDLKDTDWLIGKGVAQSEILINKKFKNIGHPHNDYLRFLYDQGSIGLGLFLLFIGTLGYRTFAELKRSARQNTSDYRFHLAVALALSAVLLSMCTDNSVCYSFVMFPLAVLIGCSLATGRHAEGR